MNNIISDYSTANNKKLNINISSDNNNIYNNEIYINNKSIINFF